MKKDENLQKCTTSLHNIPTSIRMASSLETIFDLTPRLQFNEHDEAEKDQPINKEKKQDSSDTQTVPSEWIRVVLNAFTRSIFIISYVF